MILTPNEMSAAEAALFATGVEAEPLMDRAGLGIARAAMQFHPHPGTAIAFVGDGHNGGDALVALRHLRDDAGWNMGVRFVNSPETLKPLTRKKLDQLGSALALGDKTQPTPGSPLILIDGLLGIGASGGLRPSYREAADAMNGLRLAHGGHTVAVDIPSGIDGVTGEVYPGAVVADLTCTIAYAKPGLIADGAVDQVGRLALIPLEEIVACEGDGDSNALLVTPTRFASKLPRRAHGTHKGNAGRSSIVAGSEGMTGAAVLCATSALRGGSGLVTAFADDQVHAILAAAMPPEVMVYPVETFAQVEGVPADALAIGPGLGKHGNPHVLDIVRENPGAMVVDADALNQLARETDLAFLRKAAGPRVLTPHPGEMARLEAASGLDSTLPRRVRAEALAAHTGSTVLLKGARTVIATPGEPTAFNSTGSPGMASGGVGDTLTGLIAALLAGGCSPHDAACIGSWVNGRAAEIAISYGGQSTESLIASDLPSHFGRALESFRRGEF